MLKMEYSVSTHMVLLLMWVGFHFCSLSLRASASVVTCVVPSAGTCSKTSEVCSPDRQCPTDQLESVSDKECNFRSCSGGCSGNFTSIRLTNVSAQLLPYDLENFSINVSWVITNPGVCGGFEVKVTQDGHPFRCKCIFNPSANNFVIRSVTYNLAVERFLEVSVRPFPVVGTYATDPYGPFRRPHSCYDIPERACDLRRFGSGIDLTVQSTVCNNTKTMEVSWALLVHSAETFVTPTYYVYLYQHGSTTPEHIFIVNNATNIMVRNLNADVRYSVRLQIRGHCSNTEANYSGCGNHSLSVLEQPTQCQPYAFYPNSITEVLPSPTPTTTRVLSSPPGLPFPTPTTTRVLPSPPGLPYPTPTTTMVLPSPTPSAAPESHQVDGALLILVVIPALVIVVVLAVVLLLFKRWRRNHHIISINTYVPPSSPTVTSATPSGECYRYLSPACCANTVDPHLYGTQLSGSPGYMV